MRQRKRETLGGDEEKDYNCSTQGMLAIILEASEHRRCCSARQRAISMFQLVLEATVRPALGVFDAVEGDVLDLCDEGQIEGHCCHLRAYAVDARSQDGVSFHARLVQNIVSLLAIRARCRAAAAHLSAILADIADEMIDNFDTWAMLDWQKTFLAVAEPAKRRRTDVHVKAFVTQQSLIEGRFASAHEASKSISSRPQSSVIKWMEEDLCAFKASMGMTFANSQVFSIALDAARLGKPAKDMVIAPITDLAANAHGVLSPLVTYGTMPRLLKCFVFVRLKSLWLRVTQKMCRVLTRA